MRQRFWPILEPALVPMWTIFQVFHDVILVRGVKEEYIPAYKEMAGKGYIYMIHLNVYRRSVLKKYNSGE